MDAATFFAYLGAVGFVAALGAVLTASQLQIQIKRHPERRTPRKVSFIKFVSEYIANVTYKEI